MTLVGELGMVLADFDAQLSGFFLGFSWIGDFRAQLIDIDGRTMTPNASNQQTLSVFD